MPPRNGHWKETEVMSREETTDSIGMPGQHSLPRRALGLVAGAAMRPLLLQALKREKLREMVLHEISNELAMQQASFARALPPDLSQIQGFEDLYWLFSSNRLNHGVMRLRIDQAALLYRMVKEMDAPRVIELGRYKGGGAFLLAAAGAHVVTLDNDALPGQEHYVQELEAALSRFGLREKVEIVMADALSYPAPPEFYDLVFVDFAKTYELAKSAFDHWWPALKPGCCLIMGDGKDSPLTEVVRFVSQLDIAQHGGTRLAEGPGPFVLFQKNP